MEYLHRWIYKEITSAGNNGAKTSRTNAVPGSVKAVSLNTMFVSHFVSRREKGGAWGGEGRRRLVYIDVFRITGVTA